MIKELFQNDLLLIIQNGTLKDYSDFFAMMFERQQTFDAAYESPTFYGEYTPPRNDGELKALSFPATGANWAEFQNWINTAYTLATPMNLFFNQISLGTLSIVDAMSFAAAMGNYRRPLIGGIFSARITTMTASDGFVIGTGLVTDLQWEIAYNTLLIPYERSINSAVAPSLRYIKNLVQFGDKANWFRTCTLNFAGTSN